MAESRKRIGRGSEEGRSGWDDEEGCGGARGGGEAGEGRDRVRDKGCSKTGSSVRGKMRRWRNGSG